MSLAACNRIRPGTIHDTPPRTCLIFSSPQGHLEFFVCNVDADVDPNDIPTQECFNKYPLTRAEGDDSNSPIDPNFPGARVIFVVGIYFRACVCTAVLEV